MTTLIDFAGRAARAASLRSSLAATTALTLAGSLGAQTPYASVPGTVMDLAVDSGGDLLYCTQEGELGRVSGGVASVIAGVGSFLAEPRAVVETLAGDIAVLEDTGDIRVLTGGVGPANLLYDDLYLIKNARDLMVDENGTFLITGNSPTSGVRALNWVSADGQDWCYYRLDVSESPLGVAVGLDGDLLMTDTKNGGILKGVARTDEAHESYPLDVSSGYGFNVATDDGDIAVEADGDVFFIGAGGLYRYRPSNGSKVTFASGMGTVRGLAIAASSGNVPSATGWSAYIAQGQNPTTILEVPDLTAPGATVAPDLGTVPSRGIQVATIFNLNIQDLAKDNGGDFLVSGDLWGAKPQVRRVLRPTYTTQLVADDQDGLVIQVEGVTVGGDGAIYATSRDGDVHRIRENPLQVSSLFSDPFDQVVRAKDSALGRDGSHYIGTRNSLGNGRVMHLDPNGQMTSIMNTTDTRGVSADAFTGGLFVTQWNNTGFNGQVDVLDPVDQTVTALPGFESMNYANGTGWADGDTVQDVEGNIYNASEDDFCVYRYNRHSQKLSRIGSGYTAHPAGLTIAPSSASVPDQTGFSLFVAERNAIWEIPDVPPPAPTRVDPGQPTSGRMAGWIPAERGKPRSILVEPGTGDVLVSTSIGQFLRLDPNTGALTELFVSGVPRDIVGLAAKANGNIVVGTSTADVFELDPQAGYAVSTLYIDAGIVGIAADVIVDGQDRVFLVRPAENGFAGRVFELALGTAQLRSFSARGLRGAFDPLTADLFLTERGSILEPGGEILRLETFSSPTAAGHYRGDQYYTFEFGITSGGLVFASNGDFYVAAGEEGRVYRIERSTGERSVVAGQYEFPTDVALAPGTPGVAGGAGTSLYVLDGATIYETGVPGLPAGVPPAAPPGLGDPADIRVIGPAVLGTTVPVVIKSPADAFRLIAVLPSAIGKSPGFPIAALGGNLSDTRILASNPSTTWNLIVNPGVMPLFISSLDANGESAAGMGVTLPASSTILGVEVMLDLTWLSLDPSSPNGVATVGGTAQVYLGE